MPRLFWEGRLEVGSPRQHHQARLAEGHALRSCMSCGRKCMNLRCHKQSMYAPARQSGCHGPQSRHSQDLTTRHGWVFLWSLALAVELLDEDSAFRDRPVWSSVRLQKRARIPASRWTSCLRAITRSEELFPVPTSQREFRTPTEAPLFLL